MQKINCNVSNCSHNNDGVCYSNRVDIGGVSASTECGTCCGSFLNSALYGNLTNNVNSNTQCDALICKVQSCSHNANSLCNLDSIKVSGSDSQLYSETKCASFDNKK